MKILPGLGFLRYLLWPLVAIVIDSPYDMIAAKVVTPGAFVFRDDGSGNVAIFKGTTKLAFWDANGTLHELPGSTGGIAGLSIEGTNGAGISITNLSFEASTALATNEYILQMDGTIAKFGTKLSPTTTPGFPFIIGLDNRTGITVADGSPIVLYAVPNTGATQVFRVSIEIDATAFTSGTATYTCTWTENGVPQTAVVTATALNIVTGIVRLAQPDQNTNITVQLTGAFVATVRLTCVVEELVRP